MNQSNKKRVLIYEPTGFGRSSAPHHKELFTAEAYNEEMAFVLESMDIRDREFILLGGCTGGAMSFSIFL